MSENKPTQQSESEKQRLKALMHLNVLDSPFETIFDSITQLASEVCGMPVSLISLVDEDRQWFKSNVGLPGVTETPRSMAFCAHTILTNEILEIPDASLDDRFLNNPLVTGNPDIRFYAGAPITLPLGENIGSLCVIDTKAGSLNEYQRITLIGLAKITAQLLVARRVSLNLCDVKD
jgi:GAF domain-containing protein